MLTIPKLERISAFQKRYTFASCHSPELEQEAMRPLRLPYLLRLILGIRTGEDFLKRPLKCGILEYVRYQVQMSRRTALGGPVVKTSPSNAGAVSSIPGQAARIPQAFQQRNWLFTVNSVGFVISEEEDLAWGPGTRLDHSRAFV